MLMLFSAPGAPRNPQVITFDKTTLQLQWMEPEMLNGIILYYRVSVTLLLRVYIKLQCYENNLDIPLIYKGSKNYSRSVLMQPLFISLLIFIAHALCVNPVISFHMVGMSTLHETVYLPLSYSVTSLSFCHHVLLHILLTSLTVMLQSLFENSLHCINFTVHV